MARFITYTRGGSETFLNLDHVFRAFIATQDSKRNTETSQYFYSWSTGDLVIEAAFADSSLYTTKGIHSR